MPARAQGAIALITSALQTFTMRAGITWVVMNAETGWAPIGEHSSLNGVGAPGRLVTENGAVKGTATRTMSQQAQNLATMSRQRPNEMRWSVAQQSKRQRSSASPSAST
jgi:hypothetical protein